MIAIAPLHPVRSHFPPLCSHRHVLWPVRAALKAAEDSLEHERRRSAVADACAAEVGLRTQMSSKCFYQIHVIIQAISAKEASDALASKLQQQLQAACAKRSAAPPTSSAAKLEQQILGDAEGSHHHSASSSEAEAALAGLWGGGGSVSGARAWGGADVDKQLREMKNRVQVLQMELVDARLQLERCAENEGRLNAQLQRLLSENDTALVMLGQVCAEFVMFVRCHLQFYFL